LIGAAFGFSGADEIKMINAAARSLNLSPEEWVTSVQRQLSTVAFPRSGNSVRMSNGRDTRLTVRDYGRLEVDLKGTGQPTPAETAAINIASLLERRNRQEDRALAVAVLQIAGFYVYVTGSLSVITRLD
jgi:hypothetical protein